MGSRQILYEKNENDRLSNHKRGRGRTKLLQRNGRQCEIIRKRKRAEQKRMPLIKKGRR